MPRLPTPPAPTASGASDSATTAGESKARRSRLHRWNRDRNAVMRACRGVWVPWCYEGEFASQGQEPPAAGLLDFGDHDRLELVGPDRRRFLGGLITCDAAHLETGSGSYGFVTSIKGKVLADVAVAEFADRTFLLLPPGRAELVRSHLQKYIVADRVEVLPLEDLVPVVLMGSGIKAQLEAHSAWPASFWGTRMVTLFGTELPVSRHERLGAPSLVAWVSSSIVDLVASEWVEKFGLQLMGRERLDALRVEQGLPWFGIDYGEDALPQETGIDAVDYTKGCYLGQEVIARLHYRGQAPRLMRRLRWEGGVDLEMPTTVFADGRAAGEITTVAGAAGLARLQRRVEVGDSVRLGAATPEEGGSSAAVEELVAEVPS